MKINKTYQTYPFALTVGSLLNAMDSKWNRDQNSKDFNLIGQERLSDFSVSECDESYEVNFLLPGFTKNEVSVTLKDSEITVEASIEDSEHAPAFGRKDYFRVLEIPESCDNGKVSKKLENGILKVVLPKRKELKPIEVKIR